MRFHITHKTHYAYPQAVGRGYNIAHLQPRTTERQSCRFSRILVDPQPTLVNEWLDYFGNPAIYFALQQDHNQLTVTAVSEVEVQPPPTLLQQGYASAWEDIRQQLASASGWDADFEARQYLLASPFVGLEPGLAEYAAPSFTPGRPLLAAVEDLMGRIHADFTYDPAFTSIATPLREVFAHRRGVCQDFAHLAIGCLRAQGLAARYVSGYLETQPPPGQDRLQGADASHAWFAVYLPGHGWVDFDPTNNQIPFDRHITTAWGRDYGDVTPLRGVIFGGGEQHQLRVEVDVERLPDNLPAFP